MFASIYISCIFEYSPTIFPSPVLGFVSTKIIQVPLLPWSPVFGYAGEFLLFRREEWSIIVEA